jgi:hypothetical protein
MTWPGKAAKRACNVKTDQSRPPRSSGEKVNRTLEDAARRLEEETTKFLQYLNDQVVPQVREHSSRGLREASKKLAEFAEYLEQNQKSRQ